MTRNRAAGETPRLAKRRTAPRLAMFLAVLLAVPCAGQAADDDDPTAQLSKLQALGFAYADKYMSAIAQVSLEIQESRPEDPQLRLSMHALKLFITASIQRLAVTPNPEATLLDMMVFATLHRMVYSEEWARKRYGGGPAKILAKTMQELEDEIWQTSSNYLTKKQTAEVRQLIRDWRAKHPNLQVVSLIRFSDFASLRSKSPLVSKARSGGFLVDTSGAEKSVDEALLLAERALHYSQRLPYILEWQVEMVFYKLAVTPEVRQTLEQTQGMSGSLDRFADSMDKLPGQITAERQASIKQMASAIATERSAAIQELSEALAVERVALFAELDVREKMLQGTVNTLRAGLADADKLAVDVNITAGGINEALISADKLMARFDSEADADDAAAEAFDLGSYVLAIKDGSLSPFRKQTRLSYLPNV